MVNGGPLKHACQRITDAHQLTLLEFESALEPDSSEGRVTGWGG